MVARLRSAWYAMAWSKIDAVTVSPGCHSVGEPVFSIFTSPQSVVWARHTRLVPGSRRLVNTHSIALFRRAMTV